MKIIKIGGKDCSACKMLDNYLKEKGHYDYVESYDIETLEGDLLSQEYGFMSIPVIIKLDDDGVEEIRIIGFNKKEINELF